LEDNNPGSRLPAIDPGDSLTIPFNLNLIEDNILSGNPDKHIPIYYKTLKGDNLFRIARIYFDQQIDHVMQQNKLSDYNLTPGQLILVGWMEKYMPPQIDQERESEKEEIVELENRPVFIKTLEEEKQISEVEVPEYPVEEIEGETEAVEEIVEEKTEVKLSTQNGLAIWNKSSSASGLFALHSEAKAGTLIEVTNPQLNRKMLIKVIGKIPDNSYPANVRVILSPDAARELGALDERFYVKMKFVQG
jgi:hypothetical protein